MVVKENDLLVTEYGHHEFVEGAEVSLDGVVGVSQPLEVDKVADKVVLGRLLAGLELLPLAELAPRLLVTTPGVGGQHPAQRKRVQLLLVCRKRE